MGLWSLDRLRSMLHVDRTDLPVITLFAGILAYVVAYSVLTWLKYESYGMYAWDLGVYDQSMYSTVHYGRLFFSTVEWPYTMSVVPAGTQLAVHFSPVLFLLLPIYAVFPSPVTLLVLKTIAVALGAFPVYLMGRRRFSNPWTSVLVGGSYLLLPGLQGVNWYDFQPHAFFATSFLFALYFFETRKRALCLAALLIGLSTIEVAPFWGIAMGLLGLFSDRVEVKALFRDREWKKLVRLLPSLVVVMSLLWLVLVAILSVTLGWQGAFHLSTTRRFASAEGSSILGALLDDVPGKIIFFALLFGPFAFTALFDPRKATLAFMWILVATISEFRPFHELSLQYAIFVVPFVTYASISGLSRLAVRFHPRKRAWMGPVLAASVLVSFAVGSPLGPLHIGNYPGAAPFGIPIPTEHDALLSRLVDMIPPDGSVLTDNQIFPHVSNRLDAFVLPFASTFNRPSDFNRTLQAYFVQSSYCLIDSTFYPAGPTLVLERIGLYARFGILAKADGVILFRQNYSGPLALFVPQLAQFDYRTLTLESGSVVEDPSSQSGLVLYENATTTGGSFWFGPGLFLAMGNYSVSFRMKIGGPTMGSALNLSVVERPAVFTYEMRGSDTIGYIPDVSLTYGSELPLRSVRLVGTDFSTPGIYQDFVLRFRVSVPGQYGFVGDNLARGVPLYLDSIKLIEESP